MSLQNRIPQITLLVALAIFTFALYLTITSGVGFTQLLNPIFILLLALSVGFMFLAQNPNNENAAMMYWFGAGVWGAAAYLNFQMLGVLALLVAGLSAASAFLIERESRVFSFAGPALFIGTGLALVILANMLAQ